MPDCSGLRWLQDSLLGNFDRWHETAVVRFLATSSAALVRNEAVCVARAGRVDNGASMEVSKSRAQTDLELPVRGEDVSGSNGTAGGFGVRRLRDLSRIVIPRGARSLLCPGASKSEIPRYARNDKF